ncbi:MAG: tripartite tricarboxylate transporter substrate binding protein [Betaproteobacteria bacterium]|nr:tripartite tricarboxylate transporter substrate binding protein [Betaproteobacteria bacterium]MBI2291440.1 tripartite tricarboxylate transporter substrate binding protein [Betaproteobacteria bacterium]MBI3054960.1 tripartite tricarboxylate transporter substrate binding protein [Betaproteobacteria bacterium]
MADKHEWVRNFFAAGAFFAVWGLAGGGAFGQDYPAKPIRLVQPFPPGGGTDAVARILQPKLSEALGQPLVMDHRPGAAGSIAGEIVAKSAPDGYTLFMGYSTVMTTNKSLYSKLAFDPLADFAPITQLMTSQFVLIVHPSVPAKSVGELVAFAKAKPGNLNYASAGIGSPLHLAAELFKSRAGINIVHVAYKGGGPAATAVLAGETQLLFGSIAASLQHVKTGRLRALAVTGLKRSPLAPELPTLDESGFPGYNVTAWHSFVAPAGTPRAIIARIRAETVKVLHLPDIVTLINNIGYEPTGTTPEQLAEIIRTESAMWAKVIKDANIRAE